MKKRPRQNGMAAIEEYLKKHPEARKGLVKPFSPLDKNSVTVREFAKALGISRYRSDDLFGDLLAGIIPDSIRDYIDTARMPAVVLVDATRKGTGRISMRLLLDAMSERGRQRVGQVISQTRRGRQKVAHSLKVKVSQEMAEALRGIAKELGSPVSVLLKISLLLITEGIIKYMVDGKRIRAHVQGGPTLIASIGNDQEVSLQPDDTIIS